MEFNKFISLLERAMVRRAVNDLLKEGCLLSYEEYDEDGHIKITEFSNDLFESLQCMGEVSIRVIKTPPRKEGGGGDIGKIGSIFLVFGNYGYDVISDYSVWLEDDLSGARKLANWMEEKFV